MASSQFGLGILRVKTILDDPSRLHYGSDTVVTGITTLRYLPKIRSHRVQLSGPLILEAVFQGTLKADWSKQHSPDIIRLFQQKATLHNGPFHADPDTDYHFPFAVAFPETADPRESISLAMRQQPDGSMQLRRRVTSVTVEDLPPTLSSKLSKNDSNLMGAGSEPPCHIEVSYSLSASIQMPGIDIVIVNPPEELMVLYEQPKVPLALAANFASENGVGMRVDFQDDSLVPEHARPRGFKSKTKALLAPTVPPKFCFDLRFSDVPQHVFAGQQLSFNLSISERSAANSVTAPEIRFDSCTLLLIAHTSFKDTATGKVNANHEVVMTREQVTFAPAGPFLNGHEHRKLIKAGVLGHVPSSFIHARVERSYTLRIEIRLVVAERYVSRKRDFKIDVHPPFTQDVGPGYTAALNNIVENELVSDEPPPAYEEAVAGSSNANDMPPTWEDVQNETSLRGSVQG